MKLKNILEHLKKEKHPLKYLQELLKRTENKNLKEDIKDLIEKYKEGKKAREKKPSLSLEQAVSFLPQETKTEKIEDYHHPRTGRTVDVRDIPSTDTEPRNNEKYGSNIKGDYLSTGSDLRKSLENKGLVSKTGFTTTAESKEVIKQEYGSRDYDERNEQFETYSERDQRMQENLTGMTEDLRESKRKKHRMEIYHE